MSDIAIRVEGLGKQYRIGAQPEKYQTLRDTVSNAALRPFRAVKSLISSNGYLDDGSTDTIWALKDVSFEVKRGEVVGIIGRNGAGKSTLLKILSRITEPTEGYAEVHGRVGSLLEVGTGFHPELTGRENVYLNGAILGMKRAEIDRKFDEIVAFAEVEKFVDTPVKRYSSGMYLRLAFAVAAHLDTEVLLVDEVLAVGDVAFQKKCLGKMGEVAKLGRTVFFVSHNLAAINSLCSRCLVISDGELEHDAIPELALERYLASFSSDRSQGHVLFNAGQPQKAEQMHVIKIELLDVDRQPKSHPQTWDDVVFRIHYVSSEYLKKGSFILDVRDSTGQRLLVFDSGLRLPVRKGFHQVDCIVHQLPLPAGHFFLSGGLAISRNAWKWRSDYLGDLRVFGKDVLDLGRPPLQSRMMFVARHDWRAA